MELRSSDSRFLALADQWWRVLLPRIAPFLYKAGGPILMMQVPALPLAPDQANLYISICCAACLPAASRAADFTGALTACTVVSTMQSGRCPSCSLLSGECCSSGQDRLRAPSSRTDACRWRMSTATAAATPPTSGTCWPRQRPVWAMMSSSSPPTRPAWLPPARCPAMSCTRGLLPCMHITTRSGRLAQLDVHLCISARRHVRQYQLEAPHVS